MAVVVYVCDTCKREIELPQIVNGLEVMSRCVITSGCKGKLIQTAIKSSHVRGKLPDPDPTGLKDWLPRRVYYKVEQPVAVRRWKIKHDLGTKPSLQVHVKLVDGTLSETADYEVAHISPFELEITFSEPRSGIAQCFARSSVTDEKREVILTQTDSAPSFIQISGGNVLSLAVPLSFATGGLKIGFISSVTGSVVYYEPVSFTTQTSPLSPWWKQTASQYVQVFFSGRPWNVLTTRLDDDILAQPLIVDGSPFFITNEKPFEIKNVNAAAKTFTVEGIFDPSVLPSQTIEVVGSTLNDKTYNVTGFLVNADKTTTISVNNTIVSENAPFGDVVANYPVDSLMYVLLSNEPYTVYDKNMGEVISVKNLSYKNAVAAVTSQIRGTLYVNETQKQVVYPHILV